jgi:phosphopantothenoylcysteine decarboxylase/phosphopantothenate--cysteine ligase
MGYRVAEAARDRGARVVLVSGPTSLPPPRGLEHVSVRSAEEMARAVEEHFDRATVVVAAAAVADYRPAVRSETKLKKVDGPLTLELVRTEDILGGLGERKGERLLIGFAAETEQLVERARSKMSAKKLDLIVANDVGTGFGGETNAAVLVRRTGEPVEVPLVSKRELADRICDEIVELRATVAEPEKAGTTRQ